ncbi:MAG TPA: Hsp20/alpha crystallin family protein [Candidatus Tectomicrobia bacterium]|nr:Hsp20/alpha crystallin family protein [Candidatus Tectomicrobia bacterium]
MATEEKQGQERASERRRGGAVMNPLEEMEHGLERLFPRGWARPWRGEWPSWADFAPFAWRVPRVDVIDRENEVVLRAEVPGVNKEDLEVSVSDNSVTIHGEIKREEETGEHYYQEMSVGPFSRTIRLPAAVDAKQVKVRLKHGILEMTMPKTEAEKRHKIAIEEG